MLGLEGEEIHQSNAGWSPVYVEDNLGVMSIGEQPLLFYNLGSLGLRVHTTLNIQILLCCKQPLHILHAQLHGFHILHVHGCHMNQADMPLYVHCFWRLAASFCAVPHVVFRYAQ